MSRIKLKSKSLVKLKSKLLVPLKATENITIINLFISVGNVEVVVALIKI